MSQKKASPVRAALRADSSLQKLVHDGLGAVKQVDRQHFHDEIKTEFADSIDIDDALKEGNEQMNRWDYLLGHKPKNAVVAIEPHSANTKEVSVVINKKKKALEQLKAHLRPDAQIAKWFWVSSGPVNIVPLENKKFLLDQNGIQLIGRVLQKKHLA